MHARSRSGAPSAVASWKEQQGSLRLPPVATAASPPLESPATSGTGGKSRRCKICRSEEVEYCVLPCGCKAFCSSCAMEAFGEHGAEEFRICPRCGISADVAGETLLANGSQAADFIVESGRAEWPSWLWGLCPVSDTEMLSLHGIRRRGSNASMASVASLASEAGSAPLSSPSSKTPFSPPRLPVAGMGVETSAGPPLPQTSPKSLPSPASALSFVAPSGADIEGLGADYLESGPWRPPLQSVAEEYKASNIFAGGDASLWSTTINDIASLGLGVAAFFRLVCNMGFMMVLMLAASSPALALYILGSRLPSRMPDPFGFARVSLGNIGPATEDQAQQIRQEIFIDLDSAFNATASNGTVVFNDQSGLSYYMPPAYYQWLQNLVFVSVNWVINLPSADNPTKVVYDLPGSVAAWIVTGSDGLVIAIAIVSFILLKNGLSRSTAKDAATKVSAKDYTVMVTGLPADATLAEVREHFSQLFALDGTGVDVFGNPPSRLLARRKDGRSTTTSGDSELTNDSSRLSSKKLRANSGKPVAIAVSSGYPPGIAVTQATAAAGGTAAGVVVPSGDQSSPRQVHLTGVVLKPLNKKGIKEVKARLMRRARQGVMSATDQGVASLCDRLAATVRFSKVHSVDHLVGSVNAAAEQGAAIATALATSVPTPTPRVALPSAPSLFQLNPAKVSLSSPSAAADPSAVQPFADALSPLSAHSQAALLSAHGRNSGVLSPSSGSMPSGAAPSGLTVGGGLTLEEAQGFVGGWVADVHLVLDDRDEIKNAMQYQHLVKKLRLLRSEVKMTSAGTPLRSGPDPKRRAKAMAQVEKLEFSLTQLKEKIAARSKKTAELKAAANAAAKGGKYSDEDIAIFLQQGQPKTIGMAFVSFNNEESLHRCLRAYAASNGVPYWLRRFVMPTPLLFRNPMQQKQKQQEEEAAVFAATQTGIEEVVEGIEEEDGSKDAVAGAEVQDWGSKVKPLRTASNWKTAATADGATTGVGVATTAATKADKKKNGYHPGFPIAVEQAPEPSDLVHENLGITSCSRCLRVTLTTVVTLIILIVAFGIMVVAQGYSKKTLESLPNSKLCGTEIPALYLGGYNNATAARAALLLGFGGIVVNTTSNTVYGGTHFAGVSSFTTSEIIAEDGLPVLVPTRAQDTSYRRIEDNSCASGTLSLAFRYDFRGVWSAAPNFTSAAGPYLPPVSRVPYVNGSLQLMTPLTGPLASPFTASSISNLGTAVPYGADSCDATLAKSYIQALPPSVQQNGGAFSSASCPDPRRWPAQPSIPTAASTIPSPPPGSGFCQCLSPSESSSCPTLPCYQPALVNQFRKCSSFPVSSISGCYCLSSLEKYVASFGAAKGFLEFSTNEKEVCASFANAYATGQAVLIGSSAASAVINVLLGIVIPWLVDVERHISVSARSKALVVKLAAAQTVNTLVTAVIVNAKLPPSVTTPPFFASIGFLAGLYDDFTAGWYSGVGASICITIAINSVLNSLLPLLGPLLAYFSRIGMKPGDGKARTQAELNAMFVGPSFPVVSRYPFILLLMFAAFTYGSAMPVLYGVAAVGLFLTYLVDKYLLLRFYAKPPAFDSSLALYTLNLLPLAIVIHAAIAIWAFTAGGLLPVTNLNINDTFHTGTDDADITVNTLSAADPVGALDRLMSLQTLPQAAGLILCVLYILVSLTFSGIATFGYSLLRNLTCGYICCRCCKGTTRGAKVASGRTNTSGSVMGSSLGGSQGAFGAASRKIVPTGVKPSTSESGQDDNLIARAARLLSYPALTGLSIAKMVSGSRDAAPGSPATASFLQNAVSIRRMPPVRRGLYLEALAVRWLRRQGFFDPDLSESLGGKPNDAFVTAGVLDGRTTGLGKGLSPLTGPFSKIHDFQKLGTKLTRGKVMQGYRLSALSANTFQDLNAALALRDQQLLAISGVPTSDIFTTLHGKPKSVAPQAKEQSLRRVSSRSRRSLSKGGKGCCLKKPVAAGGRTSSKRIASANSREKTSGEDDATSSSPRSDQDDHQEDAETTDGEEGEEEDNYEDDVYNTDDAMEDLEEDEGEGEVAEAEKGDPVSGEGKTEDASPGHTPPPPAASPQSPSKQKAQGAAALAPSVGLSVSTARTVNLDSVGNPAYGSVSTDGPNAKDPLELTNKLGGPIWLLRKVMPVTVDDVVPAQGWHPASVTPSIIYIDKPTYQVIDEGGVRRYSHLANPVYAEALAASSLVDSSTVVLRRPASPATAISPSSFARKGNS